MTAPILEAPSTSTSVNTEPAGAVTTILLMLDVSILERIFKPAATSALTRAEELLVDSVIGAVVVVDDPG